MKKIFLIPFAVLATVGLSACVTMRPLPSIISDHPPENALIQLKDPYTGATTEAVKVYRYADIWQVEEAHTVKTGKGLEAQFVYSLMNPSANVSLNYRETSEKAINAWAHNAGGYEKIGKPIRVQVGSARLFFAQPYKLKNTNQNCAGFAADWDIASLDQHANNTKALLGYVCASPGADLSEKQIVDFLNAIYVKDWPTTLFNPAPNPPVGPVVQGNPTGNKRFPYKFAYPFQESGSPRI